MIDLAGEADPAARMRDTTGGRGADVIMDVVGWWWSVSPGGSIGQLPANHILLRNYSVLGLHLVRYRRENPALLRSVHDTLVGMYAEGLISPQIYREVPFEEAPAGLSLLSGREAIGRVVLRC